MSDVWAAVAAPSPGGTGDPGGAWDEGVRSAVHALRTSRSAAAPAPSVDAAWALLSWSEGCATVLLGRPARELLADSLYALFLAEPLLDQREVLNIARLLRFAADRGHLDYGDAVRAAGVTDDTLAAALARVPASLPPTHRLAVRSHRSVIERVDLSIDVDELSRRFGS